MSYSNYQKVAGLLQDTENLLFTFDIALSSFELTIAYFTFSSINSLAEGDTDYKKLKAQTTPGDFFMVGTKD